MKQVHRYYIAPKAPMADGAEEFAKALQSEILGDAQLTPSQNTATKGLAHSRFMRPCFREKPIRKETFSI